MQRNNLFLHEDIPYISRFKNSADMRLAVEAVHTACTMPRVSKSAIVSGDSDCVPLFPKLREQAKLIIGITGSSPKTPSMYRRACDRLHCMRAIALAPPPAAIPEFVCEAADLRNRASRHCGIPYGQRVPGRWTVHDRRHTCLTHLL